MTTPMFTSPSNSTEVTPRVNATTLPYDTSGADADDTVWILTSTFIIFTMQSGFGLLESGSVSSKNEVNIMVKNAADVIFGGLTYWAFGYAFSFGDDPEWSNPFSGWGHFFVVAKEEEIAKVYAQFFFQSSFATTATTIVSGCMAERTKLSAYMTFSTINTLVYCFPAHWMWGDNGWLATMGAIDIAGAGPVHLVGGTTGLVATLILKPRYKRYDKNAVRPHMGSPTNALLGTFMLWWGWLGFNCGSTFGISGNKWILAARSAVSTLIASITGGALGCIVSYIFKKKQFDISMLINSLLGSLVGITGFCALAAPWESFIIGIVGALIALVSIEVFDRLEIDDPVGAVGVHMCASIWSLLVAGLFAKPDKARGDVVHSAYYGVFYGGGWYLLGVQTLAIVSIMGWTALTTVILLMTIDKTIGLRVSVEEEIMGADLVEHGIGLHSRVCVDLDPLDDEKRKVKDDNQNEHEDGMQRQGDESNHIMGSLENATSTEMIIPQGRFNHRVASLPGDYNPEIKIVERRMSNAYGSRVVHRLEYPVSRLERALAIEEKLEPMIKDFVTQGGLPTSGTEETRSGEGTTNDAEKMTSQDVVLDVTTLHDLKPVRNGRMEGHPVQYGSSNAAYLPEEKDSRTDSAENKRKLKGL